MTTQAHPKEKTYFFLRILFSLVGLVLIALYIGSMFNTAQTQLVVTLSTIIIYVVMIVLYLGMMNLLMVGHLRGNGVEINDKQFPEAARMIREAAETMGLKKVPKVFLIQSGGVLNAYATRFFFRDYVALYSDIFVLVQNDPEVLRFIIAHELAHVRHKHIQKRFWTALSLYVPFLAPAWSRACEHSCDAIAHEISPEGARKGLLLLAAGKDLYTKVNLEQYLADFAANNTAAVRFAEKFMSHPNLPKRLAYIGS